MARHTGGSWTSSSASYNAEERNERDHEDKDPEMQGREKAQTKLSKFLGSQSHGQHRGKGAERRRETGSESGHRWKPGKQRHAEEVKVKIEAKKSVSSSGNTSFSSFSSYSSSSSSSSSSPSSVATFPRTLKMVIAIWSFGPGKDPTQTGPVTWEFAHLASIFNTGDLQLQMQFVGHVHWSLSCRTCWTDMGQEIRKAPFSVSQARKVARETGQPNNYGARWWVDLHNKVNLKTHKPAIEFETALKHWIQEFKLFPQRLVKSLIQLWRYSAQYQLTSATSKEEQVFTVRVNNKEELEEVKLKNTLPLSRFVYFILWKNFLRTDMEFGNTGVSTFIDLCKKHKLCDGSMFYPPEGKAYHATRFLKTLDAVEAEWSEAVLGRAATWGWGKETRKRFYGFARHAQQTFTV